MNMHALLLVYQAYQFYSQSYSHALLLQPVFPVSKCVHLAVELLMIIRNINSHQYHQSQAAIATFKPKWLSTTRKSSSSSSTSRSTSSTCSRPGAPPISARAWPTGQLDSEDEDATATTPDTPVPVSRSDVFADDWVMLGLPHAEHTVPAEREDMHGQVLEFVELWKDLTMKRHIDALDRRLNAELAEVYEPERVGLLPVRKAFNKYRRDCENLTY